MILSGLLAGVQAIPCGIANEWAWYLTIRTPVSQQMLLDAGGTVLYAAFVLTCWSALYLGIIHYRALQAEHARALEAEAAYREARLETLRQQLNPHFLFNTLNGISSLLAQGHNKQADRMLTRLAAFLRTTLDGLDKQEISLFCEISNLEQYLEIERARLGDRLRLEFVIDPGVGNALVPALLLQPLAENAIRHGITPRIAGGKLTIKAKREDQRVRLVVADDGVGIRGGVATFGNDRRGLGLANTIERLRVLYGVEQRLIIGWPQEGGCRVEIELPWREETPTLPLSTGEHASVQSRASAQSGH
jgi:LytS/YehU family sensor histidine kinase